MSKKLSGSERRKLNAERTKKDDVLLEKIPKINSFFKVPQNDFIQILPAETLTSAGMF